MANWKSLLQNAIILDIETTGLARGASITEMALYNVQQQEATQFRIQPSAAGLTLVKPGKAQDAVGFATRPSDIHRLHPGLSQIGSTTWKDLLVAQVLMDKASKGEAGVTGLGTAEEIRGRDRSTLMKELAAREPFLHRQLSKKHFEWLGEKNNLRDIVAYEESLKQQLIKDGGRVRKVRAFEATIDHVLSPDSEFIRRIKGNAIWIANASFESKQIGAKVAVLEAGAREEYYRGEITKGEYLKRIGKDPTGLRDIIKGASWQTSDIMAVTGVEVNRAIAKAKMSGDWSDVYRAYLQHTGAGDVRDIIDVVRSQQSMSQKLGLMQGSRPAGLCMDVSARLYGFAALRGEKAGEALLKPERHLAIFDAATTEAFVQHQALRQADALHEVIKGTDAGKALLAEAKLGTGALADAIRYAQAWTRLGPEIQTMEVQKRFTRMLKDFGEAGHSIQVSGARMGEVSRLLPSGSTERTPYAFWDTTEFTEINRAAAHIAKDGAYANIDAEKVWQETVKKHVDDQILLRDPGGALRINKAKLPELRADIRSREIASNEYLDRFFQDLKGGTRKGYEASYDEFLEGMSKMQMPYDELKRSFGNWKALDVKTGKALRYGGLFAAGLGMAGAAWSAAGPERYSQSGPSSFRQTTYQQWLMRQSYYGGLENNLVRGDRGMSPSGVAAQQRSQMSDFGSPYRGPIYSEQIFEYQDLLAEREKYLREIYSAQHYDPRTTLGGYFKHLKDPGGDPQSIFKAIRDSLRSSMPTYRNNSFITAGEMVDASGYAGMAKGHLFRVNLSNYKISAEDADTIVLQKKGVRSALSGFFGMNEQFKLRMAGIDAPETAHGGGRWKSAMPYADAGATALQHMLAGGGNIELLVDPTNITYGRQVATVFQDGRNINLDLVKKGYAAYLPFRKKGHKEMYNPQVFSRMEKLAQGGDRNMWGSPFFQSYRDIVAASGKTITFNTFTQPEKLAKNSTLMSAAGLMYSAENQGFYGNAEAVEAAAIGDRLSTLGFGGDYKNPILMDWGNAPHKSYMSQMQSDISGLMRTKGGRVTNKLSRRSGYGELDKTLTLDTMGTTDGIWNKRRAFAYQTYGTEGYRRDMRKQQMAQQQRHINNTIFNSPINHHRM